jgi:hypothetical protein
MHVLEDNKCMKKVYDNKWNYVTAHELKEGFFHPLQLCHISSEYGKRRIKLHQLPLTWQRNYCHY